MSLIVQSATSLDVDAVFALWCPSDLIRTDKDPGAEFHFALSGALSHILIRVDGDKRVMASVMVGQMDIGDGCMTARRPDQPVTLIASALVV